MKPTEFLKEALTHASNCPYNYGHDCTCGQKTKTHDSGCSYNYGHDCDCSLSKKKETTKESDDSGVEIQGPFEAYGIRGMDRKSWRKTFKNVKQMEAYCERWDAEVYGTRDLESAKRSNLSPAMTENKMAEPVMNALQQPAESIEHVTESDPRPVNNFEPEDIKALEKISDIATLKARCMELISATSQHQMKPEKVSWFRRTLEQKNSRLAIIKMMYDLLLAGEGNQVIGTKWGMGKNSYRQAFGEDTSSSSIAVAPSGKVGPSGPAGSLFGGPQKRVKEAAPQSMGSALKNALSKVEPGSKLDNKIKSHNRAIKAGMSGTMAQAPDGYHIKKNGMIALGETRMVKKVTESSEAWRNYYDSIDDLVREILAYVSTEFGGRAWFKGGSYAYMIDTSKPNQLMASDGSPVKVQNIAQGLDEYCDRGVFDDFVNSDPTYWSEFFRPVKSQPRNNQADHETANLRGESKSSNILSGISLAEGQLNEYKPKIIPKTMAGGKLNPNHPGNTSAIANEKEAKYKRQEQVKQERAARAVRAKEKMQRDRQKEKAHKAGQKAKAALGSDKPTTPLEKKAQDAMWQVWNAIAPDMMQAIRGGGYDEDEDLLEDPYWVAEVCCDANNMQRFAELSPEEEREILDTLDSKTLARLASNFGI